MSKPGSFWTALGVLVAVPPAILAAVQLGLFGDDSTDTTEVSPSPAPTVFEHGEAQRGATTSTSTTTTITSGSGACVITITHFGAELKAEPDHQSRTVSGLDERQYTVLDDTLSDWAGLEEQWFQIEHDGRIGWVVDLPILLDKSSACP